MASAVDIRNLVVEFPARGGAVRALDGLSLSVAPGRIFGFLGPNGAGKTTTMHVLLGFFPPTSGEAHLFGASVLNAEARRRIGYLPEHPTLYPFLTGRELLRLAARMFGMSRNAAAGRIEHVLRLVDMESAADRRIAAYSRGMMQRIALAQALVNDPDLVILDEPTGGLDPLGRLAIRGILENLRRRGKTVFFSSHELSEVETVCDEAAILRGGRVVASGAMADLVPEGRSLERFFIEVVQPGRPHETYSGAR
jgi:ABC-2 type transport system ATP-binding protein